jgi:hypothetical protein
MMWRTILIYSVVLALGTRAAFPCLQKEGSP